MLPPIGGHANFENLRLIEIIFASLNGTLFACEHSAMIIKLKTLKPKQAGDAKTSPAPSVDLHSGRTTNLLTEIQRLFLRQSLNLLKKILYPLVDTGLKYPSCSRPH